jgi:Domain of unknown function (DUF5658)
MMMHMTSAAFVTMLTVSSGTALAADRNGETVTTPFAVDHTSALPAAQSEKLLVVSAAEEPPSVSSPGGDVDWSLPPIHFGPSPRTRPSALPALYVSLAAFHLFDAYSTRQGLARRAREANPLMQGAFGNPAALWALKIGTAALPMVLAERMWRTNRVGAIVTMVLVNGAAAAVAANNARVLRQQR